MRTQFKQRLQNMEKDAKIDEYKMKCSFKVSAVDI